jgi:hypothetical protein
MNATQIASFVCYITATLIAFSFSFIYLFRKEFMPYHSDAVEHEWQEIDKKYQTLILALMRAVGGGWLACGISILFLLVFPFRSQALWALIALPLIGFSIGGTALYATLYVRNNTKASPPVNLVIAIMMLLGIGFILSIV